MPALLAVVSGGDSDVLGALLGGSMCVFFMLAIVYSVAVSILFSAAMTNYAMKGTFGSMFAFGEIMAKVRGGTGYFTAWLFTIVICAHRDASPSSVLSATGIGAILYPAVTYFMLMASGHVLGQWAANAYAPAAPCQRDGRFVPPAAAGLCSAGPACQEPTAPAAPPASTSRSRGPAARAAALHPRRPRAQPAAPAAAARRCRRRSRLEPAAPAPQAPACRA